MEKLTSLPTIVPDDDFLFGPRYDYAVEAALKLASGREYPISMNDIFADTNWRVVTYSELAYKYNLSLQEISEHLGSSDGSCCLKGGKYYIFYNDSSDIGCGRRRFTIAHEIGHIVLGHLKLKQPVEYQVLENEANVFARNLLMPPVHFPVDYWDTDTISDFFKVSKKAAEVRLKFLGIDRASLVKFM